jgi:LmbE family N-acetylglucosaminyl deacetylase
MYGSMSTVVSFHAHPDDEVLLTGGTLAKLAADGHQVVIAVATDGSLGARNRAVDESVDRLSELAQSAKALGVARVEYLGYADSGHGPVLFPDPPGRQRFARAPADEAARRLAALLAEVGADLLLGYDAMGGYGHRDHLKVHEVGRRAAELTGLRLLEATMPRERAVRFVRFLQVVRLFIRIDPQASAGHTPYAAITHRVNVRRYARQKQAALAAHRSQLGVGRAGRAFSVLVRVPPWLFGLLLGVEWYVEPGRAASVVRRDLL